MTLEDRVKKAQINSYEARHYCEQVCRERSQLREEFHEQLYEWRVARMKHAILLAEVKKSYLLADVRRSVRGAEVDLCGLPIQ